MARRALRVLLAEDISTDADLELRELRRAGIRVEHRLVDSEPAFRRALAEFSPEIILSDFSMPSFDGMFALEIARELAPDTPFIFVSGTIGEEYAIRALHNGATDYVLKSNLLRLPAAVERALRDSRERAARRAIERELEVARKRLAAILESLPDVLWSVALPSDRLAFISPAAQAVYGYTAEEFLARPDLWIEVVHPDDRKGVEMAWRSQFDHVNHVQPSFPSPPGERGGGVGARIPYDVEYRAQRPDGSVRWIHDRGRLVLDEAGQPMRIDGVARDISDAMEQRRRIARLSRIRDFTSSINLALVRVRQRDELFAEICRVAVEAGGLLGARVGLLEPETQNIAWMASHGVTLGGSDAEGLPASANEGSEAGRGIVGRSLRSGRPEVWNDMAGDPGVRHREQHLANGTRALGSFPLIADGKPFGVLTLRARERGYFDDDEVRLIAELASNISFALELIEKRRQLDYLAYYDALTGLPNRTLFHDRLTQAIEAARWSGTRLALMVFDVERFKGLNDAYGQSAGDRVLQHLALRLRDATPDKANVARLGNDLFAVLFPAIREAADVARTLATSATRIFEQPFRVGERELQLAAKSGIAVFPEDGADADVLFRNAEASLKRAKSTGERYMFYAPHINARVAEQVELEARLRRAAERREFTLHYQPKVDLASGRIVGAEALMRWNEPENGMVPPVRFIPVLEETGLILPVGRWAIAEAIRVHRDWRARGLPAVPIAVNVSALQMRDPNFVEAVRDALGGQPGQDCGLDLEITESLLMADVDTSIRRMREIRTLGVGIALDDFGTGYSSLAYLSKLPIDTLKIDRSFVRGMVENPDDTSIATTIISLGQALRMKVVAEGVEDAEQARLLKLLRCDQIQGYLVSPPVPQEKFEELLLKPVAS